jgi:protein-S-isoprenylcysteine O-methyltransferase Ste14
LINQILNRADLRPSLKSVKMRGFLRVVVATALYAAVHSWCASRSSKKAGTTLLGERAANALYRPLYLFQSLATMGVLVWYARRQPGSELYRLRGAAAAICRLLQAGGLAWAVWSAYEVGLTEILGIRGLREWVRGEHTIPPPPEAQGPALCAEGELRVAGPFRWSQHPLNFAPQVVMWCNPIMTTRLLAFNMVASLYLVLGSWHEAIRLRAAYGPVYEEYMESGVRFYLPGPQS